MVVPELTPCQKDDFLRYRFSALSHTRMSSGAISPENTFSIEDHKNASSIFGTKLLDEIATETLIEENIEQLENSSGRFYASEFSFED